MNEKTNQQLQEDVRKLREALELVMDQVDFVAGNCGILEPISAVLPVVIIKMARIALNETGEYK